MQLCFPISSSNYQRGAFEEVRILQAKHRTALRSILHRIHAQHSAVRGQQPWDVHIEVGLWGASFWLQGKVAGCVLFASRTPFQAGLRHTWTPVLKWRVSTFHMVFALFLTGTSLPELCMKNDGNHWYDYFINLAIYLDSWQVHCPLSKCCINHSCI